MTAELLQEEPRWQRRAALPPPQQPTPTDINVWALVKDFVGKGELSKMATPVQFLEPLSELQQRCEDLEYSELLDQAGFCLHAYYPWTLAVRCRSACFSKIVKACLSHTHSPPCTSTS